MFKSKIDRNLERKWQTGGLDLFCSGKIITTGKNKFPVLIVYSLFLLCALSLLTLPVRHMINEYHTYLHLGISLFFILINSVFLFLSTTSDPGILVPNGSKITGMRPPRKQQFHSATVIGLRYCDSCDIFQPPRCWHCAVCNNCILQFDHHCPWIGNCVGKRNYHLFVGLIFSGTVSVVYTIVLCIIQVADVLDEANKEETDNLDEFNNSNNVAAIILLLIVFIISWSTTALMCFHFYLIVRNLTTYEHIRSFTYKSRAPNSTGLNLSQVVDYFVSNVPSYVKMWLKLNNNNNRIFEEVYFFENISQADPVSLAELLPSEYENNSTSPCDSAFKHTAFNGDASESPSNDEVKLN